LKPEFFESVTNDEFVEEFVSFYSLTIEQFVNVNKYDEFIPKNNNAVELFLNKVKTITREKEKVFLR